MAHHTTAYLPTRGCYRGGKYLSVCTGSQQLFVEEKNPIDSMDAHNHATHESRKKDIYGGKNPRNVQSAL